MTVEKTVKKTVKITPRQLTKLPQYDASLQLLSVAAAPKSPKHEFPVQSTFPWTSSSYGSAN